MADEPNKVRAEIRARQAEDGKKAMAEYEANAAAVRIKTEKLRALRLAREASEQATPAAGKKKAAKPAKTKAKSTKNKSTKNKSTKNKSTKKTKAADGNLSEWIEEQANSGRNT